MFLKEDCNVFVIVFLYLKKIYDTIFLWHIPIKRGEKMPISYLAGMLVNTVSNCNHHHHEEGDDCGDHGCGNH